MKKRMLILIMAAAGMGLMAGCGSLDVDSNTICLGKNGKITEGLVEDFSKDYYDEAELEAYVNEAVETYGKEHKKGDVKVSDYRVEEQKAYLTLKYKNTDAYGEFNGVDIFHGTIVEAQAEGYDFDTVFVNVEDGKAAGTAETADVLADEEKKVLILHENMDIIVPGTILYVSKGVEVTAKDTVTVPEKEDTTVAQVVYVIHK